MVPFLVEEEPVQEQLMKHSVIPGYLNMLCLIVSWVFLSVAPIIIELFNYCVYDVLLRSLHVLGCKV